MIEMSSESFEEQASTLRRRHGFFDLKVRDRWLYGQLRGHIRALLDVYDWGFLVPDTKEKPRANTKENLNFWLDQRIGRARKISEGQWRKHIHRLSLLRLEEHCNNESTIYVTSNPFSQYALVMLDYDDHDEENPAGDCLAASEHVKPFFPRAYHQTSTFGRGYHGYVFVSYANLPVTEFRALLGRLQKAIRVRLKAGGFRCEFEIKGIPGLVTKYGTYTTCGQLAKFPRLTSDDEVRDYLERPLYDVAHLQNILDQLNRHSPPPPLPVDRYGNTVSISKYGGKRKKEGFGGDAGVDADCTGLLTDPAPRMGVTGFETARKLGRAPTRNEILAEYEAKGRHTGNDDDGNRAKLAQGSADWLAINFRPGTGERYSIEKYTSLIAAYVTPAIRECARRKNRSRYTDEELAVTLYTIEKSSLTRNPDRKWQFTVPNNSIMGMMARLGLITLVDRQADPEGRSKQEDVLRHRIALMKHVLVEAKLACVIDEKFNYRLGKKYGIGPAHHEYDRFRSFAMQFGVEPPPPDIAGKAA